MTPNNQTTHAHKMPSPLAAGLTGLVIGAAGAAVVALSDEDNRKKASKKALQMKKDLQKWSTKTIKDLKSKGDEMKAASQDQLEEANKEASKELEEAMEEKEKN